MRRGEVLTLRWERINMDALMFRVEHTKTGVPLELPLTWQLSAILERRLAEAGDYPTHDRARDDTVDARADLRRGSGPLESVSI